MEDLTAMQANTKSVPNYNRGMKGKRYKLLRFVRSQNNSIRKPWLIWNPRFVSSQKIVKIHFYFHHFTLCFAERNIEIISNKTRERYMAQVINRNVLMMCFGKHLYESSSQQTNDLNVFFKHLNPRYTEKPQALLERFSLFTLVVEVFNLKATGRWELHSSRREIVRTTTSRNREKIWSGCNRYFLQIPDWVLPLWSIKDAGKLGSYGYAFPPSFNCKTRFPKTFSTKSKNKTETATI